MTSFKRAKTHQVKVRRDAQNKAPRRKEYKGRPAANVVGQSGALDARGRQPLQRRGRCRPAVDPAKDSPRLGGVLCGEVLRGVAHVEQQRGLPARVNLQLGGDAGVGDHGEGDGAPGIAHQRANGRAQVGVVAGGVRRLGKVEIAEEDGLRRRRRR